MSGADRARWLAELSEALDDADQLATRLGLAQMHNAGAVELLLRLAAARAQVMALQLGRPDDQPDQSDPKWSSSALWPDEPERER